MQIFIPITKIDEAKRLVYGCISEEVADKSGEILDYQSSKPQFQKWSEEQDKISGGKSKGNLRAMHGNIAAGKFTDITFDDANKRIEGVAKVVDDAEWAKCVEGVYAGFSIGGGYARRWKDPDNPALRRYTPELAEVSLVDNPCVPTATFEFIKADGTKELRKFNHQEDTMTDKTAKTGDQAKDTATDADAATKAAEADAKADPAADQAVAKQAPDDTKERPQDKGGVTQGFQARDGSFHLKKADALARNEQVEAESVAQPAMDALKKLADAVTKAESGVKKDDAADGAARADAVTKATETGKSAETDAAMAAAPGAAAMAADAEMRKGMYSVAALASLLNDLNYLRADATWEAQAEGDNSAVPAKLKECVNSLAEVLKEMVGEETAELTADKAATGDLAKKGAAISAATRGHIEKMMKSATDHMDEMGKCYKALGMDGEAEKADQGDMTKTTQAADNATVAENTALKKVLSEMTPTIDALVKRVEQLESLPMPSKGPLRVVEKTADGPGNVSDGDVAAKAQELLKSMSPEEVNMVLMKAALSKPSMQIRK